MVYVALLRGINVGGNNMVSMRALRASFENLGFTGVTTYINSGNVVFTSPERDARVLEDAIDRMLERTYKLTGKTVVRSKREMARVVRTLEKTPSPDPEWKCNVIFLRSTVDATGTLTRMALPPETDRVVCCPGTWVWFVSFRGFSRSAMMKVGRSPLYKEMTVRNVNTTKAVPALMEEAARREPGPGAAGQRRRRP